MVFLAKELIEIAPFSKSTFVRRLSELDIQKKGNYYRESEAEKIADQLGYLEEWKEFVKQKKSNGQKKQK